MAIPLTEQLHWLERTIAASRANAPSHVAHGEMGLDAALEEVSMLLALWGTVKYLSDQESGDPTPYWGTPPWREEVGA